MSANLRIPEEEGFFPPFSVLFAPSEKWRKGQKKAEKGRFRPISRKGSQTPLKPPFVTPPFAAASMVIGPLGGGPTVLQEP